MLSAVISGCGGKSGSQSNADCATGSERCACYPDNTCDDGLACASDLCVSAANLAVGGSTGGSQTTSGGTAPSATGGTGNAGDTSSGGSPSSGGSGGSAGCPAVSCAMICPLGFWKAVDGCDSCACVPPENRMTYSSRACPSESILLGVAASRESGAVNRWILDFHWTCSVPTDWAPKEASAQVAIVDMATRPIDSANTTIVYPLTADSPPAEFRQSQMLLSGNVAMPDTTLTFEVSTGTYLSIRREGDHFTGGIMLQGVVNLSPSQYPAQFSGSFDVPVPM